MHYGSRRVTIEQFAMFVNAEVGKTDQKILLIETADVSTTQEE